MLPGERHLLGDRRFRHRLAVLQIILDLAEDPRVTEAGASYHDAVNPVFLERPQSRGPVGDVSVAYYWYVHAGVALHLAYQRPVGGSLVHLAARASVDRESLNANVLQALREFDYDFGVVVPPETGLDRHRLADSLHYRLRDGDHLVGVAHHSGAGAAPCDLGHGAAEVDVYHVGAVASRYLRRTVRHSGRLHHGFRNMSVNLYAHRGLLVGGAQLREGF